MAELSDRELQRELKAVQERIDFQRDARACPVLSIDAVREIAGNLRRRRELAGIAHHRWGRQASPLDKS